MPNIAARAAAWGQQTAADEDVYLEKDYQRRVKAVQWVDKEIRKLIDEIQKCGGKQVKFGMLFSRTTQIFEAVSGTLVAAKKRGVLDYEGQLLLSGHHDDVVITLLQTSIADSPLPDKEELRRKVPTTGKTRGFEAINNANNKCAVCEKTVYINERKDAAGKVFHKTCFVCAQCKRKLETEFCVINNTIYCQPHYMQIFQEKGGYSGFDDKKANSASKPTPASKPAPIAKPTPTPIKPTPAPVARPAPIAKPTPAPVARPAPIAKPTPAPVGKPAPIPKPASKPVVAPEAKPISPRDKPPPPPGKKPQGLVNAQQRVKGLARNVPGSDPGWDLPSVGAVYDTPLGLVEHLARYGTFETDIFRTCFEPEEIERLTKMVHSTLKLTTIDLSTFTISSVAFVLKRWLLNHEPLFSFKRYPHMMKIQQTGKGPGRLLCIAEIIRLLPVGNIVMLFRILGVLERCAIHEDATKMDAAKLAYTFGPCLLRPKKLGKDIAQVTMEVKFVNDLVRDMIMNIPDVFQFVQFLPYS